MVQLLNTPLAWLSQFLACIHERKHSLFSTCKTLRDLVVAQADRVQCLLDTGTVTPVQAARCLQLLQQCKEGAEVKLVLKGAEVSHDDTWDLSQAALFSSWLTTLCTQDGALLQPVTHVAIKAHVLGGLIPAHLAAWCPRMTHLTTSGGLLHASTSASVDSASIPQLRHLTIHEWSEHLSVQFMQQQLRQLPNLQSLHIKLPGADTSPHPQPVDHLMQSIPPLCVRLKSFSLLGRGQSLVARLFVSAWPQLQQLHLPNTLLYDTDVELLLEHAPQVSDLHLVWFRLTQSYADRKCKWRHLRLKGVTCQLLAWLPLAGLETLRFQYIMFDKQEWQYVQVATTVLSGMKHALVLESPLHVFDIHGFLTDASQVTALLPLLHILRQEHIRLESNTGRLHHCWLQVLQQLQCCTLSLRLDHVWEDWWCAVLQQIPQLKVLHLIKPKGVLGSACVLGAQLASFCAFAPRPCQLHIDRKLALGVDLQQQLVATMRAAGHQHVSIQIV